MRSLSSIAVLFLVLAMGGCSTPSCTQSGGAKGLNACIDFPNIEEANGACNLDKATLSTEPCPSAGRVGRCTSTGIPGRPNVVVTFNSYAPATTEEARAACSAGTFAAN